jgi:hypothetical protein
LLCEEGHRGEHHGHKETTLPSQVLHRLCPLRCVWVAPGLAGVTMKKTMPGTRHFFASDYTRAGPMSRLEICIGQICFSDSLSCGDPLSPRRAGGYSLVPHPQPNFTPTNSFRGNSCLPALPSYNASRP